MCACRRPRRGSLKELAWEASGVRTLAADATQDTAPDTVFAALQPDVLVICAGAFAPSACIQDQSWDDFSANWETDVKASFLFCRAALQGRLKAGSRVVLISGGAAFSGGPPNSGGYSGAKQMQMFLAAHSQKEADRLGLGLRFMALAPMRIMAGTGVGQRGISSISAYLGISPADFHVIEPAYGAIASLTVYVAPLGPGLFAAFGLPPVWSGPEA
nr:MULTISPECIES: SDR family oxidoreductase [Mesorhizobium]